MTEPTTRRDRELAQRFHETYERLAPEYGYETRGETKVFHPHTQNGRLMTAVCAELFPQPTTDELIAELCEYGDLVIPKKNWLAKNMKPEKRRYSVRLHKEKKLEDRFIAWVAYGHRCTTLHAALSLLLERVKEQSDG